MVEGFGCCLCILYPLYCYWLKLICEKAGHEPGLLIWVPFLQNIPLLRAAGLPLWLVVAFAMPYVNVLNVLNVLAVRHMWTTVLSFCVSVVANSLMWINVCKARGKGSFAMVVVILLPFIGIPYLAYSESTSAGPLVVSRRSETQLVLGPRRWDELVALFCFVFGIFCLSLCCIGQFAPEQFDVDPTGMWLLTTVGAPVGIVGTVMLWFQERVLLDRSVGRLVVLRAVRKPLVFDAADIAAIEVRSAAGYNPGVAQCFIVLRSAKPVLVTAGAFVTCDTMARLIELFLVPPPPESEAAPADDALAEEAGADRLPE